MRASLQIIIALFLFGSSAFAQDQPGGSGKPSYSTDYVEQSLRSSSLEVNTTDYNWGRRRINYDYPVNHAVRISNTGSGPLRVIGLYFESTDPTAPDIASFTLNAGQVTGRTLGPGKSSSIDAVFSPRRTGSHRAKIIYVLDPPQSETVFSLLSAYSTKPSLITKDYIFGEMVVDDNPEHFISNDKIEFSVPDLEEIDSVTIIGFEFQSDEFSGHPDFTHAQSLPTPYVLKAGQRFLCHGLFKACMAGNRTAALRAITADGVDVTSYWNGTGAGEASAPWEVNYLSNSITILPNPAAGDAVTITCTSRSGHVALDLLDQLGRTVRHEKIEKGSAHEAAVALDIAGLPAGAYIVRITTDGVVGGRPLRIIR